MPKTKEELEQLKEDYKKLTEQAKELSDEELENVTGGCTTYGNGWDGEERPIVVRDHCCRLFEAAGNWEPPYDMICANCKHYSYRKIKNVLVWYLVGVLTLIELKATT